MSKTRTNPFPTISIAAAIAAAAVALLVAASARGEATAVTWAAPTPADRSVFAATVGSRFRLTVAAAATSPDAVVRMRVIRLPAQAAFRSSGGSLAKAQMDWTPAQPGDYSIQVAASVTGASAPTLTYTIRVKPNYTRTQRLTNAEVAHWAPVPRTVAARKQPRSTAPVVTLLQTKTSDDTQNIVLVLDELDVSASEKWYRVRLPILPNNQTGWVPAGALGTVYTVQTHLYVDRATETATLERRGVTIFRTRVGVGRPYWPTPRGEFYIRSKLTNFGDPFYGPVAFGTSARSAVLTDWPGGGFVGVHGTSMPELIPGRISHGCIRMRNEASLRLAQLMPVGTPLTIT